MSKDSEFLKDSVIQMGPFVKVQIHVECTITIKKSGGVKTSFQKDIQPILFLLWMRERVSDKMRNLSQVLKVIISVYLVW